MHAQVTIGGLTEPVAGAVLDLNSTAKGGLILSNVTILDLEWIPYGTNVFQGITAANADVNTELRGVVVYNNGQGTSVPAGIYVWNGYYWTQDGNCGPVITSSSPSPVSVVSGKSTRLSVTAFGCPGFTYQWYASADGTVNSLTSIGGATGENYDTSTGLTAATTYYYCCKVSSSAGETLSDVFTVNVAVNPANLTPGSGTFTGKICFDLAQGNDDAYNCGLLSGRLSRQTDFLNRNSQDGSPGPYSGVQVYTFTPNGSVSHVRFAYEEVRGISVERIETASPYATGNNISTACKVTVYYRTDLNTGLLGTTRDTGNRLKLYAIYNSSPVYSSALDDEMLEILVSLQDCSCCGAYTDAAHAQWLNFMCHNLGANESYDPFTPRDSIHGTMYKWGVATPALTQYENVTISDSFSDWESRGTPPNTSNIDWNMITDNPCPAGWRVPTYDEWVNVLSNNTLAWQGDWTNSFTNFSSGLQIGDALFLPAAGSRMKGENGKLNNRGESGIYWSSSAVSMSGWSIVFDVNRIDTTVGDSPRFNGYSVRCVAD
jgi:uncharacterized protein (TIGR02145 family)